MRRRFQVFVSSTFEDLREERQAAVEAILKGGHIPAGMELFTAGSKSQLEVIRKWIEDSDIFMLILGSRYGTIEPTSGLSYVELEFDYARSLGKPFFSVVLTDQGREAKVQKQGSVVLEKANEGAYAEFRKKVTSQLCAFFASPMEVRLAVLETLPGITATPGLVGWVSEAEVMPSEAVSAELARLSEENQTLRTEVERLDEQLEKAQSQGPSFDEMVGLLSRHQVHVPEELLAPGASATDNLLSLTARNSSALAVGVTNGIGATRLEAFLFYSIAAALLSYGLAEPGKTPPGALYQRIVLSRAGIELLNRVRLMARRRAQPADSAGKKGRSRPK